MFYRRLLVFCLLLSISSAFAQKEQPKKKFNLKERFISSAGVSYNILYNSSHVLYGANFTPSLNLLNSFSDFSISLAIHLSGAYHPSSNKDSVTYSSYSFPAFVQANVGHLASQDFYSAVGLFVGAGYSVSIINGNRDQGFSWTTGFRFWFLKQSFTLRYVQSHLNDANSLLHELSLQINVGKYLQHVKDNNKLSRFVSPFQK